MGNSIILHKSFRMPYNPITLEYHPDDKGLELMGKDEEAKVK
jgi:hypothetical protein